MSQSSKKRKVKYPQVELKTLEPIRKKIVELDACIQSLERKMKHCQHDQMCLWEDLNNFLPTGTLQNSGND